MFGHHGATSTLATGLFFALVAHFVSRAWSFAYFIPNALRFEKLSELSDSDAQLARRWTHLSWLRGILAAVSIISLSVAILHLGRVVY